MLEKIRTLNPNYQIHELDDSFKEYGRIIKQDMQEAIDYATSIVEKYIGKQTKAV